MRQLTGLDAAFVYLETHSTPMHIGGVYLIDSATAGDGFGYERFREFVSQRLHIARTFRQRLVEVPLDLGHPFWVEDPEFELDRHVPHYGVPQPAGKSELESLAAKLFARPLARSRPLWELAFVDGVDRHPELNPGSFAVVARVHHAAIDGLSGAEIMGALLDPTPEGRETAAIDPWKSEELPSAATMVARTYGKLGSKSVDLARMLTGAVGGTGKLVNQALKQRLKPPALPFSAPKTLFNKPVSAQRSFGGVEMEFARIKAVRKQLPGATVNDILLSLCGGALRQYLAARDALPEESMVAMVPISVRADDQRQEMGNQVSAMLAAIGTDIEDPIERVRQVHANAVSAKGYSSAVPANRLMEFVPSETAALASRLYTRMKVADRHRPFFNLVITNVPGPPVPLYMAGARVTGHIGHAPIFDGIGLILVIFSLAGKISIGITSTLEMMPDTAELEDALLENLEELERAVEASGPIELADAPMSVVAAEPESGASRRSTSLADLEETTARLEAVVEKLTAAAKHKADTSDRGDGGE